MHAEREHDDALDNDGFLEALGSIRREVRSMGSDVKSVLRENEALKAEVTRLRRKQKGTQKTSQAQRIKRDLLEQLEQLQSVAGKVRRGSQRARPVATPDFENRHEDDDSHNPWMKKMMMFMMMAELV